MTRSIARPLCDSWACTLRLWAKPPNVDVNTCMCKQQQKCNIVTEYKINRLCLLYLCLPKHAPDLVTGYTYNVRQPYASRLVMDSLVHRWCTVFRIVWCKLSARCRRLKRWRESPALDLWWTCAAACRVNACSWTSGSLIWSRGPWPVTVIKSVDFVECIE